MSLDKLNIHIQRLHSESENNHQIPWSIHCAVSAAIPRACPNMVAEDVSRVASVVAELMTGVDTSSVQFVEALTREQARQRKLEEIAYDKANNIEDAEFKDVVEEPKTSEGTAPEEVPVTVVIEDETH